MQEQLLVVEDDLVLQLSLSAMLRREGFAILAARSLAEARVQLLRERPTAVLLDLSLPDGSSFDILEELAAQPDGPLVIVSAASESLASAMEALRLGAFDFLSKPISHELLRAAVGRAVQHYRLRRAARESERLRAKDEAMGAATRTLAHQISQHLTVIMGETQLLQEELVDLETRASLDRILRATEQVALALMELRASHQGPARDVAPELEAQGSE